MSLVLFCPAEGGREGDGERVRYTRREGGREGEEYGQWEEGGEVPGRRVGGARGRERDKTP